MGVTNLQMSLYRHKQLCDKCKDEIYAEENEAGESLSKINKN